jgi:hypothetical protein
MTWLDDWLDQHDEAVYAFVLFFGGAGVGGGVTLLLIHFLTGWN